MAELIRSRVCALGSPAPALMQRGAFTGAHLNATKAGEWRGRGGRGAKTRATWLGPVLGLPWLGWATNARNPSKTRCLNHTMPLPKRT